MYSIFSFFIYFNLQLQIYEGGDSSQNHTTKEVERKSEKTKQNARKHQ